MPTAAVAQVNARIDAQLKREGDQALADAGYTPTQAIRALWKLAIRYASEPGRLVSVLNPNRAEREDEARVERRKQVEASLGRGATVVEEGFALGDLSWPPQPDTRTYDELRESAAIDAYASDMGWDV